MNSMYSIDFIICGFIVYCFIIYFFLSKKGISDFQNKIFLCMVGTNFISSICNFITCVMINDSLWFPREFIFATYFLYLLVHMWLPFFFALYAFAATGRLYSHNKKFFILFSIPIILNVFVLCANCVFNEVFYIKEGHIFYNPGIYFLYGVTRCYSFLGLYLIAKYKNSFSSSHFYAIIIFVLIAVISAIIQYLIPYWQIEMFAQSMAVMCLLFTVENHRDLLNLGTMVYNRDTFMMHNVKMLNSKRPYTVVLMKIGNIRFLISVVGIELIFELMADIADYLEELIGNRRCIYDCNHYTFALVFDEKNSGEVKRITDSIYTKFQSDWRYKNMNIPLTIVMGLIHVPLDLHTVDSIMTIIDTTEENLHEKVSLIKGEQVYFLHRRASIENAISKSLLDNSLQVYFQPILDCRSKTIHGAEALVRLYDSTLGFISPEEFIYVAEKNGNIRKVGKFLFDSVCEFMSGDFAKKIGIDYISLNLSTMQCLQNDLPYIFKDTLVHYGLTPDCIHFDVSEVSTITAATSVADTIHTLHTMGFHIALDNYGTGHADSSSLFTMDFSAVNIDRSILWKADESKSARIFLQNTIAMLKKMNMTVIVEGVETEAQKDFVMDSGADFCQGYYFSSPLPKDQFIDFCMEAKKLV